MWIPTHYPSSLIESFSKGTWHCYCLVFVCNNPTYYPSYIVQEGLTFLPCLWVWHPQILPQLPDQIVFCAYFSVLNFYLFISFTYLYIYIYIYIFFIIFFVCFCLFLLISFLVELVLIITSRILHPCPLPSSRFTLCFSTLVLSLGVTTIQVNPVPELDLFFLLTRLCPSLSQLYTYVIIIIYYYQLYFVKVTPWKN